MKAIGCTPRTWTCAGARVRTQLDSAFSASANDWRDADSTASLGGTVQLSVQGDRATATLRGTPPAALAQWLAQVRINARLLPLESQLARDGGTGGWSGSVVLGGPALAGN